MNAVVVKRQTFFWVLMLIFGCASCAYRFTNEHIITPNGIRTIAVEAIYDTSHQALPHQVLWEALQTELARTGHLILASPSEADALMRVHLYDAGVFPSGSIKSTSTIRSDPQPFEKSDEPPLPQSFRNLTKAGEYTTQESFQLNARIEVLDLRNRKKLLSQTYSASGYYSTLLAGDVVPIQSQFLRAEESFEHSFFLQCRGLAQRVAQDLLVRP